MSNTELMIAAITHNRVEIRGNFLEFRENAFWYVGCPVANLPTLEFANPWDAVDYFELLLKADWTDSGFATWEGINDDEEEGRLA